MRADLQTSFMNHLASLLNHYYHSPRPFDFFLRSRNLHAATDSITVTVDGLRWNVLDDGGRLLQPQEWIRRFQGLDAMFYVVSLPGYCQTHPGQPSTVGSPPSSL